MKKIILPMCSILVRKLRPLGRYLLARPDHAPLSRKFGMERGKPIDRFWIEAFLSLHKTKIQGHVLEVGDNRYTLKFGTNIISSSVVDNNPKNTQANIVADLTHLDNLKDNTYDCILLTHVLGIIPEYELAIKECFRVLKPGGVVLVTSSVVSPVQKHSPALYRFTPLGLEFIFGKVFGIQNVKSFGYGNVLAGQAFWIGASQEDLSLETLTFNDPEYPCISTCIATKKL